MHVCFINIHHHETNPLQLIKFNRAPRIDIFAARALDTTAAGPVSLWALVAASLLGAWLKPSSEVAAPEQVIRVPVPSPASDLELARHVLCTPCPPPLEAAEPECPPVSPTWSLVLAGILLCLGGFAAGCCCASCGAVGLAWCRRHQPRDRLGVRTIDPRSIQW